MRRPALFVALLLVAALGLGGCDSARDRAEKHFQSGLALAEAGDIPRALIELRNAFTYDPAHPQARLVYARLLRQDGDLGEAYAQYQRVVEVAPDTLEARHALAEMAILIGDWAEADRHAVALQRLDPAAPGTGLVRIALDYRKAMLAQDAPAAAAAADGARRMLAAMPEARIAWHVVIDHMLQGKTPGAALAQLDAALAVLPDERAFHQLRLRLLAEGRQAALGPALEAFVAAFPQDAQARQMMVAWYIDKGDLDAAEAFLRKLADAPDAGPDADGADPDAGPDTRLAARMMLVEFLAQARGPQGARAELDRRIAEEATGPAADLAYRARRAALDFDLGQRAEGVAAMTALVDANAEAAPGIRSDLRELSDLREVKIMLAQMLVATGDPAGAKAQVDAVLAEDPVHVAALKLRAGWLIDADRPAEAITALRSALAEAPRDAGILTLMGRAHDRDGAHALAGERYAQAVEASGRAPAESVFYARFLVQDGRLDSAAAVLGDALLVAPRNIELLTALADIELRRKNLDGATAIATTLRGLGDDRATAAARAIDAEGLLLQDRVDETITYLQNLATTGTGSAAAAARMVQLQVEAGKLDAARAFLDARLAADPTEPTLRFLRAGVHVLEGQTDQAEAIYRDLLAAAPAAEPPLRALYGVLQQAGRTEDARTLLQEIAVAAPAAALPRLMQASEREAAGDIDGAIALYESLYAADSSNLIIANNLASLIAGQEADAPRIARAAAIARRLRGSSEPAFQDTYGWLEYRRGNLLEALQALEPAARGLPQDPRVQAHLGLTYLALERPEDARRLLTLALALAGDSALPLFSDARVALAGLPPP